MSLVRTNVAGVALFLFTSDIPEKCNKLHMKLQEVNPMAQIALSSDNHSTSAKFSPSVHLQEYKQEKEGGV